MFFGVLLIIMGVLMLLEQLGVLPGEYVGLLLADRYHGHWGLYDFQT